MVRKHAVLLVALLVVTAFWVDVRLNVVSLAPAQAQAKSPDARKWEYSVVVGLNWDSRRNSSSATIGFITTAGRRLETLDSGSSGDPLSAAFAKLGAEGWEFVGQIEYNMPTSEGYRPNTWLFKRPAL
jgi:hypothetical protein